MSEIIYLQPNEIKKLINAIDNIENNWHSEIQRWETSKF